MEICSDIELKKNKNISKIVLEENENRGKTGGKPCAKGNLRKIKAKENKTTQKRAENEK